MTERNENKGRSVLVDSATSLCDVWSLLIFHHPALMRLQGRQKYSLPDNGAQRRKKQIRKAHVKEEEIPVYVESPGNAIKGGSRWGRCSKTPEETHNCRSQAEWLLISIGCYPRIFDEKIAQ